MGVGGSGELVCRSPERKGSIFFLWQLLRAPLPPLMSNPPAALPDQTTVSVLLSQPGVLELKDRNRVMTLQDLRPCFR